MSAMVAASQARAHRVADRGAPLRTGSRERTRIPRGGGMELPLLFGIPARVELSQLELLIHEFFEQPGERAAFPLRDVLEPALELGADAPAVDLGLHALHCITCGSPWQDARDPAVKNP